MYQPIPIYKEPTFWLAFVFLGTAAMVIARLVLIRLRKYRWLSYNTCFFLLCLVTCLLRAVFFMFYNFWMDMKRHLLGLGMYWFATNTQFATFSLLVVFYVSITNDHRWRRIRIPVWVGYSFFNLLFLAAFIASLLVQKFERTRDRARSAITATTFFLLVIALGYYGFRVWRILLQSSNPNPKLHGISALKLFIATLHIMVIYLSRAIYAILSDVIPSLSLYFGNAGEVVSGEILSCVMISVWEVVPTIIILILFWETTPAPRGYSTLRSLTYLNADGASINSGDTEGSDFDDFQPVPTRYQSTNAISYPTGRESTSLFLPSSSVDSNYSP